MEEKEKEKENTRDPLEKVKPVAAVSVVQHVRFRFRGDYDAVDRVEQQRNEYAEYLDEKEIRHIMDILNMVVENSRAAHRGRVRVHVNEEINAQRHHSRQLMQFFQQEGVA
jgi:hypothetical protein